MLLKILPVFLIFWFMVLGCRSTETVESTKVASTEIYQSYSINGSKNSTSVNVTFRVGGSTGSTVDLDAPSSVSHNGKELTESAPGFLKGTDYRDAANQFVPNHKFLYKDASGKVWENEITMDALEVISENLTISKMSGGTIMLSRPVSKDEEVEFSLVSEKNPPATNKANGNTNTNSNNYESYSNNLQVSYDESRSVAKINPSSTRKFVDGKAKLTIAVRKNKTVQQSAKGGSIDFSYESQTVAVMVIN
jgi:hypothetical protein